MELPPPRLLSTETWKGALRKNSGKNLYEIEVPLEDNLYWSILISYLLLEKTDEIFSFIKDLERDGFLSTAFDFDGFFDKLVYVYPDYKKLSEDSEIINVFNAFKNKLNRNKNKLNESSDTMTLNIAAEMLKCNIDVLLPEELQIIPDEHDNLGNLSINICLYKDKKFPKSEKTIDVFRSAITLECSNGHFFAKFLNYNRNLQVRSFLKDAKYPTEIVDSMTLFLENNDVCGKKFLPELIKRDNIDLFNSVYKFPDITKRLEVGNLETNPINTSLDKSPFALAAAKPNTEYIRTLYYYSANCCYLFEDTEPPLPSYPHLDCFGALRSLLEKSVRNPNEAILENLKKIQEIFQNDISIIDKHDKKKIANPTRRTLEEFSRLNKCHQSLVKSILKFKKDLNKCSSDSEKLHIRKDTIKGILQTYKTYFYFNEKQTLMSDKYDDYLNFDEYFQNIDSFFCLSFFDYIYLLKKELQLQNEDMYGDIECSFLLFIKSNEHFPKFKHDIECSSEHDKINCEKNKNYLRFIPFLHREALLEKINKFLEKLYQPDTSFLPQNEIKDIYLRRSLPLYPEIIDELLIVKVEKYLNAAADVLHLKNGINGILVIERALQVLGESLKPRSTEKCVVSYLLGSRLPPNLKKELISIRNYISKYKNRSCEGRLAIQNDSNIFFKLQKEIKTIKQRINVIIFTQHLRTEKLLMNNFKDAAKKENLKEEIISKVLQDFKNKCSINETNAKQQEESIKFSIHFIRNFLNFANEIKSANTVEQNKTEINSALRAVKYLFVFLNNDIDENYFKPYLHEIRRCCQTYRSENNFSALINDISCFSEKYCKETEHQFKIQDMCDTDLQFQTIELFLERIKKTDATEEQINAIKREAKIAYKEANNAKVELIKYIERAESITLVAERESILKKLIVSKERFQNLKKYFENNDKCKALTQLKKEMIPIDDIEEYIKRMYPDKENYDTKYEKEIQSFLLKLVYQYPYKTYTSTKLQKNISDKLQDILMRKVNFLLNRMECMKSVLIDDSDELHKQWTFRKNKGIKQRITFIMREKFLLDMAMQSCLESALFDCLNILNRKDEIYEKEDNLLAGINIRNFLAHGNGVLELVGGYLDQKDLSSDLLKKMLELIDDYDAIKTIKDELLPNSNTFEVECFKSWINDNKDNENYRISIAKVTSCNSWENYLFLFPLI